MAHALVKNDPEADITVFLMADAVLCAKAGGRRHPMATTISSG
jgi:sulfur relay (sulfurtransferase) complex TusBCD TusD component (DsrE family)